LLRVRIPIFKQEPHSPRSRKLLWGYTLKASFALDIAEITDLPSVKTSKGTDKSKC